MDRIKYLPGNKPVVIVSWIEGVRVVAVMTKARGSFVSINFFQGELVERRRAVVITAG